MIWRLNSGPSTCKINDLILSPISNPNKTVLILISLLLFATHHTVPKRYPWLYLWMTLHNTEDSTWDCLFARQPTYLLYYLARSKKNFFLSNDFHTLFQIFVCAYLFLWSSGNTYFYFTVSLGIKMATFTIHNRGSWSLWIVMDFVSIIVIESNPCPLSNKHDKSTTSIIFPNPIIYTIIFLKLLFLYCIKSNLWWICSY